ncbi:hypothetical protein COV11_02110 [Candidatus Woesearchaeota archaeon CG10_big_fil_rev_8_21_14_0_10_30_7]|nr:MAG: hypothetical protein COV11_02110 [Candidatus Woesearchaeota archaeon CG10_big_fil_rev_8_21_14_0_10_30_7]
MVVKIETFINGNSLLQHMSKRVKTKKRAGPYLIDIIRPVGTSTIEAYLENEFNIYCCSATIGPNGMVRCFEYDSDKVVVAGYLKSFKTVDHLDYSIIDDHWEILQVVPKKDRKRLEKILKNNYKTVNFWD